MVPSCPSRLLMSQMLKTQSLRGLTAAIRGLVRQDTPRMPPRSIQTRQNRQICSTPKCLASEKLRKHYGCGPLCKLILSSSPRCRKMACQTAKTWPAGENKSTCALIQAAESNSQESFALMPTCTFTLEHNLSSASFLAAGRPSARNRI